jgi:hypothetical protein
MKAFIIVVIICSVFYTAAGIVKNSNSATAMLEHNNQIERAISDMNR